MNCQTCHTPNDRTARSCSTCGTSLDKSAPASSQTGGNADPNRRMTIAERRAAGIPTGGSGSAATTTQTVTHDRAERQWQPAAQPSDRTNAFALTSMILGILGGTIVAIIFGHLAKAQIRRTGERGSGMATAGLTLGYVWTAGIVIYFISILVMLSTMKINY